MNAFEYASPRTKEDAVRLLAPPAKAAVLAGGTDLLSLMKDRIESPARLVSIKSIGELRGIRREQEKGLRLGALVTLEELLDDGVVAREYPALRQAAEGVASPQIRSMGTVAGDLCQRPRCWYYRSGFGLLAMQGGRSMVLEGDNRYHAILGNSGPAYFVHASSLAPALIALGAKMRIFGSRGAREVALADFYRIPQKEGEREHTLAADEVITEILVPAAANVKSATYEVRQKQALDWPLAAAAVALKVDAGAIRSARVVLGHVAPIPWVAPEAEKALIGAAPGAEAAEKAGEAAVRGAQALSRNLYKVRLAQVAVKRAVLRALGQEV